MARGDHLQVDRTTYAHHGIDCGDGTVVEYGGGLDEPGPIQRVPLAVFARGSEVAVVSDRIFPPEEVVQRALSRLGEEQYDLLTNNCEHFATWATTGQAVSYQVKLLKDLVHKLYPTSFDKWFAAAVMSGLASSVSVKLSFAAIRLVLEEPSE